MNSSVCATVRVGFNSVRYADIFNERTNQNISTGHISLVNIGNEITISGSGEVFDLFQASGILHQLTGMTAKPVSFFEPGFKNAALRIMNLDESYYGMQYDVRDSKKFIHLNNPTVFILIF